MNKIQRLIRRVVRKQLQARKLYQEIDGAIDKLVQLGAEGHTAEFEGETYTFQCVFKDSNTVFRASAWRAWEVKKEK